MRLRTRRQDATRAERAPSYKFTDTKTAKICGLLAAGDGVATKISRKMARTSEMRKGFWRRRGSLEPASGWLDEIAGHVNDDGLVGAGGGENLLRGFVAGERVAVGDEIDVAEQNVVAALANELDGADGSGGAVDVEAVSGEAFFKEHADAFFVVEDEDGTAAEDAGVERANRCGKSGRGAVENSEAADSGCGGIFFDRERKKHGEGGAADGERFDVDGAAVFTNDRGANAEAEAGAAAGAFGGVEGIEEFRKRFGEDADAVVLDGDGDVVADAADANLNAAGFADFANGVLGIADEIEEDLDELIGVADDGIGARLRLEFDADVVAAQRMFVELERALDEVADVERFFLWRGGAREFEQVLDDASGAAGLAMGEVELALGGFVDACAFAQ